MSKKLKALRQVLEEDGFLTYRLQTDDTNPPRELFCIEEKLRGLGFLFEASDANIPPNEGDLRAIGRILTELADDLQQIRNFVEPRLERE